MGKNTFHAVSDEWLKWISPDLKASSIVRYTNIINKHLLPKFGTYPIDEITEEDAITFKNRLLCPGADKGSGLSPSTVSTIMAVFKSIMEYAVHVKKLPIQKFGKIKVKQMHEPLRVFSRIEQERLNRYLLAHLNPVNLGILLTLYTGLRIGELCALKWEDISLEEQSIYVHQTLQRLQTFQPQKRTQVIITKPKSNSSIRHIPIPDPLIKPLFEAQCEKSCFLLTGKSDEFIEPRTMENRFKTVTQSCDIRGSTFHTCRHTFATRCVELGFDIKSLSEILGHSSVTITMNRYVHPSMEFKKENMKRLSTLLDNII